MNQTAEFIYLPAEPEKGLKGLVAPNALHILLVSPQMPHSHIVYDGDKYWHFGAGAGWESRKEFKGLPESLRREKTYYAIGLNLPFKIRGDLN